MHTTTILRLGLVLALLGALPGLARAQRLPQLYQYAYYRVRPRPDSALTRQAQLLRLDFDRAGWATLASALDTRPRPVGSYIGPTTGMWQQAGRRDFYYQLPPAATSLPTFRRAQVRHSTRQFGHHMFELGLERRVSDYERLSDILLTHATKVRRIREAVPVLLFAIDTLGQVRDVAVDKKRSKMGLTARSRKIILKALEKEHFRALEARVLFRRPRPAAERWQRLRVGPRLHHTAHVLTDWALYHQVRMRVDRCGGWRYVKRPRFWKGN